MVIWLLFLVLSSIVSIVCYVTNAVVVLFCDDDGELPWPLHLWQTWDNSCNPSDILKIYPDWLLYDWKSHYIECEGTTTYLKSVNRIRWYTRCINDKWTVKERIQRYILRVLWLTRNCAYGWGFYVFGIDTMPPFLVDTSEHTSMVLAEDGEAWRYTNTAPLFTIGKYTVLWNILIGWKINTDADILTRAMIAVRFLSFKIICQRLIWQSLAI